MYNNIVKWEKFVKKKKGTRKGKGKEGKTENMQVSYTINVS